MLKNRLKQCRIARRLTVKQLSERSGMTASSIRDIENRAVLGTLPWHTIKCLSEALGMKPNQVFPFSE